MRAVKDQAILPVVTDKMMGNVPAFFRGVLLSDFPHGAGFDELAHLRRRRLSVLRSIGMTDSFGACSSGMFAWRSNGVAYLRIPSTLVRIVLASSSATAC